MTTSAGRVLHLARTPPPPTDGEVIGWTDRPDLVRRVEAGGEPLARHADAVERLYLDVLGVLVERLNAIHGLEESRGYWELLLYRFLTLFVADFYSRRTVLRRLAEGMDGDLRLLLLDPEDYRVAASDEDHTRWIRSFSGWDLQFWSVASRGLPVSTEVRRAAEFPGLDLPPETESAGGGPGRGGPFRDRIRAARLALQCRLNRRQVALLRTHLSPTLRERLERDTRFRLIRVSYPSNWWQPPLPNRGVREALDEPGDAPREAAAVLGALRWFLPTDYVEAFPQHRRLAGALARGGRPEVAVAGFIPDFGARTWVAECRRRGTLLVFVQHGGNFGESRYALWEPPERRAAHRYVTWGWREDGTTVPLPAPRLLAPAGAEESGRTTGDRILLVLPERLPYPELADLGPVSPREVEERFLSALGSEGRRRTTVRLRTNRMTPDPDPLRQVPWLGTFPEVRVDPGRRPIEEALAEARVVVVGYPFSTTFPECVATDRVVLVLAEGRMDLVRPAARSVYRELAQQEVVLDDAERGGRLVAEIVEEPRRWWECPARQEAVRRFREQHARSGSLRAVAEGWSNFFETMIDG